MRSYIYIFEGEKLSVENRDHCMTVFNLFDDDKTGHITLKNLKRVAQTLGETISDVELENILKRVNTDSTGEISFDEFYAVVANQKN